MKVPKNMCPSVSVIVTVYNSETTIDECLRSIKALDYSRGKLETIVVDDGSADRSVEKIRAYPVRLVSKAHSGYPSSMNSGIREAGGDIILIVDADTYVEEDYLAKLVEEFEDPNVGITSGYVATKPNAKYWARIIGYESEDRYNQMKSKYVDFITSTCTAYRRAVFDRVGLFDEKLRRGSDEDLAHRAAKGGWKIVLKKSAICYHDWVSSPRRYFRKQLANGIYEIRNFLSHPELLRGREQHPPSLYIPMLLTLLAFLWPLWLLLGIVLVSLIAFLGLVLYHTPQAMRIIVKKRDWTMLSFPVVFNLRYVAWLSGICVGLIREVTHR